MADILKLALVFVLIVGLLRKKLPVGWVMLAGAVMLALLYRMPVPAMGTAIATAFYGHTTLEFLSALMLIRVLEHVMRERELLSRMMSASRAYLRSRRAAIVAMPVLIGLLPSVGGAYFSAPMVEEATRDTGMSAEEKGFVNFWFRHIWELTLPLYPGLLLAVAVSGVGLRTMVAANAGCAAVMLITGFAFSMRELGGAGAERPARVLELRPDSSGAGAGHGLQCPALHRDGRVHSGPLYRLPDGAARNMGIAPGGVFVGSGGADLRGDAV